MILAAAQFRSKAGDVASNIDRHLQFADEANRHGADIIVFPELSLSGYEPTLAEGLETTADDTRFEPLKRHAQALTMTICAGMPLMTSGKPEIGMIVWQPDGRAETYGKQILHDDELPFFSSAKRNLTISIKGQCLVPAICYESLQTSHAEAASKGGANVYLASVAKPEGGMRKAVAHYPTMAKQHKMTVIVANAVGPSDNFVSVGQSAVWNSTGGCLGSCNETDEALLIADMPNGCVEIVDL
ncbi:MAG: carbon-nitrogen hydrolase family protein [Pacificimonas sp.]|nr:carbon-nitrogen hydrolase family protein [Pacificimonas sp.]